MNINFASKTIEISKWTNIKATHFESEARSQLAVVREEYPKFEVVVEDLPFPDMKTGKGATYDFMECYIYTVRTPDAEGKIPEMETFKAMRQNGCSYFQIKNWFVKEFRFDTLWS